MSALGRETKLDLINSAQSKITISGITAPAQPDDTDLFLSRLEGMMYEIEGTRNICCRYNFTENPNTADPHGMDFPLFEPISNILTTRTIQDYGLQPTLPLEKAASAAVSSLSNFTFQLRETQYPRRQARGAGNTLRYNRWQRFYRKPDRVPIDCIVRFLTTSEINDYSESWASYLLPGETISSFEMTETGGIRVSSPRIEDDEGISFRVEALTPSIDNGVEQILIRITTTTGRKDERLNTSGDSRDKHRRQTGATPAPVAGQEWGFGPFNANFNNGSFIR